MGLFFGWIIFSFVAGMVGSNRKIGFWAAFFLSVLLSPLIGLIIAFASKTTSQQKFEDELLDAVKKNKESDSTFDLDKFKN